VGCHQIISPCTEAILAGILKVPREESHLGTTTISEMDGYPLCHRFKPVSPEIPHLSASTCLYRLSNLTFCRRDCALRQGLGVQFEFEHNTWEHREIVSSFLTFTKLNPVDKTSDSTQRLFGTDLTQHSSRYSAYYPSTYLRA